MTKIDEMTWDGSAHRFAVVRAVLVRSLVSHSKSNICGRAYKDQILLKVENHIGWIVIEVNAISPWCIG
jgi:hypothetical protein